MQTVTVNAANLASAKMTNIKQINTKDDYK